MTYGEIKIEALRLMFASNGTDIHPDDLSVYEQDESYRFYLIGMPESLNRCFSRIEERRVLPDRTRALRREEGSIGGAFIRFDLDSLIPDLFDIERVVYEDGEGEYNGSAPYEREGNTLVLPIFDDGVSYSVVYKPSIKRVRSFTESSAELGIPEGIASIIPYYLKGDLFRDDEPDEANEARLWFEQALDEIGMKRDKVQGHVKSVYSQEGFVI